MTYSDNANAGTAMLTLTAKGNYTGGTISKTFAINKAALTIKADDKTISYAADIPAYTYMITGYENGENASVITGSPTLSCSYKKGYDVGGYFIDINVSGLSAANCTITDSSGRLDVEKTSGAAVSGAPAVAMKTAVSITVSAVENAKEAEQALLLEESEQGMQSVEYALSTNDFEPTTGWQSATTFNNLTPDLLRLCPHSAKRQLPCGNRSNERGNRNRYAVIYRNIRSIEQRYGAK